MTDHTWYETEEVAVTLSYRQRMMKLGVCVERGNDVRLASKLCFLSYLAGNGKKITPRGKL